MAHQRDWTRCKNGHKFTPENTYVNPSNGHRRCRICKRDDRRVKGIYAGHPDLRPKPQRVDTSWYTLDELAAVDTTDDTWRDRAVCATDNPSAEHTARWFTGRGHNQKLADAVALCEQCPVRLECLAYGVWEKFGVWGGVSERARRNLRRDMADYRERRAA